MADTNAKVGVTIGTKADTAPVDRYTASVQRMNAAIKDFFASKNVATAGAAFGGSFAAAGATVSAMVGKITEAISGSSELASEMALVERRVGLAGEAFQVLTRAGKASSEELIAGLAIYRRKLGEALSGDLSARKIFGDLGLSPEALTRMPVVRQLEAVATAVGQLGDKNREAAAAAEFFGRGYSAILPVLEKLRTDGYDKLRDSVAATAGLLDKDMAAGLNKAKKDAAAAGNALSVAFAPAQLRLLEMKATISNLLAGNAGTILSAGTALAGGFLTASTLTALTAQIGPQLTVIGSQAAGAFSKGFGVGVALLPGIVTNVLSSPSSAAAFAGLGRALATPFGAAFAVAVGGFLIFELERVALEEINKRDAQSRAFAERFKGIQDAVQSAASPEAAGKAQVSAAQFLAEKQAELDALRKRQQDAAAGSDNELGASSLDLTENEKKRIENLEKEIQLTIRLVGFANTNAVAIAQANEAKQKSVDLAFQESAELEKTRNRRESLMEREAQHNYEALTSDAERLDFLQKWRDGEEAAFNQKIAATQNAELASDRELEKRVRLADIDAKIAQVRHHAAQESLRSAEAAARELQTTLERYDREDRHRIQRDAETALQKINIDRARSEGDFTKTAAEKFVTQNKAREDSVIALTNALGELQKQKEYAQSVELPTDAHDQEMQRMQAELAQLEIQRLTAGPDPTSWVDQTAAALTQLRDQWGTTAQQIGQSIAGTIGTAVDSVSDNITQALLVTGDWGKALGNIEMAIGTEIVRAIVTMGVRWVATQIMMAVAGKALAASSLSAVAPLAAAQSALWAAPATLSTIASAGTTAAAAPAEIAGAIGLTQALSLAGYLEGGAAVGKQLAWLSEDGRPEFVFSAPAVENLGGIGAMEAMHREALKPASSAGSSGGTTGGRGRAVRVLNILDDGSAQRAAEIDALANDPRFENHVVRIGRKRRAEIGIQV